MAAVLRRHGCSSPASEAPKARTSPSRHAADSVDAQAHQLDSSAARLGIAPVGAAQGRVQAFRVLRASQEPNGMEEGMERIVRAAGLVSIFLSAQAFADGAKPPNWPDISRPIAVGGGENDAALVIGIDDYERVADIPGAADNARDWYRYLVDGRKLPIRNVRLLRNGEGDRETILQATKDTVALVKPGGAFWLVFIGHCAPSQDGKEGILVGADTKQTAVSLFARSVKQSELQAIVAATPSVMVLDSCFSGRAHNGSAIAPGLQPLILTKSIAAATTTMLTAAQADQFAGGLPGKDRPAFSYLVLGALRGWGDANGDGQVTAAEALDYATKALSVLPIGRTQTPELVGGGASRVLASRGVEREPDLDAILTGEAKVFPDLPPAVIPSAVSSSPAARDDAPASVVHAAPVRQPEDAATVVPSSTRATWGWSFVGAGALTALGGTALYFATVVPERTDLEYDVLVTYPESATPGYLWGGLAAGAVMSGVGAYLLLTEPGSTTAPASARVVLGPNRISLVGSF